jgi:endonuclease YncB( thermonuclease family)
MFYFLHRLVKWFFIALVGAGLYWLWLQREALEPVYVWYDVYENGGLQKTDRLTVIQGKAVRVIDGHTFQMHQDNKSYSVRLTGFETPEPPFSNTDIELEKERRRVLRDTVLNQAVKVEVTYDGNNTLLGIVTANHTNLTTLFITNSLSKFNRAYVKSVPRDIQYRFFAAQRLREKEAERKTALALRSEQ